MAGFIDKLRIAEEIELRLSTHGETEDNGFALRPLKSLHRVDGDAAQLRASEVQFAAYAGYLVAVGHDDAQLHRPIYLRRFALLGFLIKLPTEVGDELRLSLISLGRKGRTLVGHTGVEHHATIGRDDSLMIQRNGAKQPTIEMDIGKPSHLGVHTSLAMESVHAALAKNLDEAFEERAPTVGQPHLVQTGIVDLTFSFALLHHCRQLLVITDEDEAFDSQLPMMFGHKEREEVGFKKLGGLVDDGQREVLERKEGRGGRQRGGDADHNTHHLEELRDFCHVLLLRGSVFQQIR